VTVPFRQQAVVLGYIIGRKLRRRKNYPLVLMLEPLFQCNLRCAGCGKVNYCEEILKKRMTAAECISAAEECGCPVVSIAGGEPLLHPDMPDIVRRLADRRKFVYLCTNGLLLNKRMDDFGPSPYLTFSIHLDGCRELHDTMARRKGLFDEVIHTIGVACQRGFRVNVNCTLYKGVSAAESVKLFEWVSSLGVEGITVAPAFSYERAQQQEVFLDRDSSKLLFQDILRAVNGHRSYFNHTPLYLDFLAGNRDYQCTPWGNPTRNVLGWQRPCYLLSDEGYAPSFKALMEETDWGKFGVGRNPKCRDCMVHSGFEATAVEDTLRHPFQTLKILLRGHRTQGRYKGDR
jgi:hopanoid biosynthesis associated radical SAM protein HpnH